MSVHETPTGTDEKLAPRSVLRHRPIESPRKTKKIVERETNPPIATRASRPDINADNMQETIREWKRKQNGQSDFDWSAYKTRVMVLLQQVKGKSPQSGKAKQHHPTLYLGLGMIAALVLWLIFSSLSNWFTITYNDMRYGRPRTYHADEWVGHNEQNGKRSHFIAMNLDRRIQVIELPGGDASKARVYMGPQLYSAEDELMPVELRFVDVNNDKKKDMLILFRENWIVYINHQDTFRQMNPGEREQVEKVLKDLE